MLAHKEIVNLSNLEVSFTLEEIKRAMFGPGPDGFPMSFFQKFWNMVSVDLAKMCEDFYLGKANLERIN